MLGFVVGRCHCSGPAQLSLRRSGGWGGGAVWRESGVLCVGELSSCSASARRARFIQAGEG